MKTYTRKELTELAKKFMTFMTYADTGMNLLGQMLGNIGARVEVIETRIGITAENEAIKVAAEKAQQKSEELKGEKPADVKSQKTTKKNKTK